MTGWVDPVLAHRGWEVETVLLDRGDGPREWIEVRTAGQTRHFATVDEVREVLASYGLDLSRFVPVDTIDDGCE